MKTRLPFYVIAVAIAAGTLAVVASIMGIFSAARLPYQNIENAIFDSFLRLRGPLRVDPNIVLVDIDTRSIEKIGRWPWDRRQHATMITLLSQSGAAVIGYNVMFDQPAGLEGDNALVAAIQKAKNIYLPIGFNLDQPPPRGLLRAGRAIEPSLSFRGVATGIGHVSSNRDSDGTVRRVPLMIEAQDGSLIPALSFAMLKGYFNLSTDELLHHLNVPLDPHGMIRINYTGQWENTFAHFSFIDLLEAWQDEKKRPELLPLLNGKIVLVSNTNNVLSTPLQKIYPGSGIHAHILNTLLTQQYLREVGMGFAAATVFFFALTTAVVTLHSRWIGLSVGGLIMVLYPLVAFGVSKWWSFPLVPPVLSAIVGYVMTLLYQHQCNQRSLTKGNEEKERLDHELKALKQALQKKEGEIASLAVEQTTAQAEIVRLTQALYGIDEERKTLEQKRNEAELSLQKKEEEITSLSVEQTAAQAEIVRLTQALHGIDEERKTLEQKRNEAELSLQKKKEESTRLAAQETAICLQALQKECASYGIITRNKKVLGCFQMAKNVAKAGRRHTVLIQGETGTGKELIARAIYEMGTREGPLVTLNCAEGPKDLLETKLFGHTKGSFTSSIEARNGLFKKADGGTIFLDEIGDMDVDLQAKLLRVLQHGTFYHVGSDKEESVDVQIIAATNKDLLAEVRKGTFREDLYYRLAIILITLPPLWERPEDIELLTNHFLKQEILEAKTTQEITINDDAMMELKTLPWQGNIRDLENVISAAFLMRESKEITKKDIKTALQNRNIYDPPNNPFPPNGPYTNGGLPCEDREFLDQLLGTHQFNPMAYARRLGMGKDKVLNRLKGICFQALERHNENIAAATEDIAGKHTEYTVEIAGKIEEYCNNLENIIKPFQENNDYKGAAEQWKKTNMKNVPSRYHNAIHKLIMHNFEGEAATGEDIKHVS